MSEEYALKKKISPFIASNINKSAVLATAVT
jgi:hypothetical protein